VIIDEGLVFEDPKRGKKRKPASIVTEPARDEKKFELEDLMEPFQINTNPVFHPVVAQVLALALRQQEELKSICAKQLSLLSGENSTTDAKALSNLSRAHQGFVAKLSELTRVLRDLRLTQVLEVHDIQKMREIEAELSIQAQQIEVYTEELSLFQGFSQSPKGLLRLIIRDQPFPYIYVRSSPPARSATNNSPILKTVERDISVKLEVLTGTLVKVLSAGSLEMEARVGQKSIPCSDFKSFTMQLLNTTTRCDAQFSFVSGTGMSVCTLEFRVNIQYSCVMAGNTISASESLTASSGSFVVITNESQYAEALSVLYSSDLARTYPSMVSVPWPLIANGISRFFILASRQSMVAPPRPLLPSDLEYMRQQWFQGLHAVTHTSIKKFWKWFGVVLRNLRYQRHLQKLWERRLIYGFVRKSVTDGLLSTRDYGSFILRFSESSPGCVAVCYKVPDIAKPVKNYIVKPEDIRGKTLPEFLLSRHELIQILQFISHGPEDINPVVRGYDKLVALPQTRSKQTNAAQTNVGGYETVLF